MTFCILGSDRANNQIGIAYSTVTLAGGGTSPYYSHGGDIVVVQAYGNLSTAQRGAMALDAGETSEQALAAMQAHDPAFEHRQIGIMARNGTPLARTGVDTRPWAGHVVGDDFIAMGNVLVGEGVVEAMAASFADTTPGEPLADRLLSALEAGRDAGGQAAPDNGRYDERSALLRIIGAGEGYEGAGYENVPAIDLRIDMASNAVTELRRVYTIYTPVVARRLARAKDPAADLPTSVWEATHLTENPPPPALKGAV